MGNGDATLEGLVLGHAANTNPSANIVAHICSSANIVVRQHQSGVRNRAQIRHAFFFRYVVTKVLKLAILMQHSRGRKGEKKCASEMIACPQL